MLPGANAQVTPEYVAANRDLLEASDLVVLQLEIPWKRWYMRLGKPRPWENG